MYSCTLTVRTYRARINRSSHPNINALLIWAVGREYPAAPLACFTAMPLVVNGSTLQELSDEWDPVEFPDDAIGGLRADEDKGQLKTVTLELLYANS